MLSKKFSSLLSLIRLDSQNIALNGIFKATPPFRICLLSFNFRFDNLAFRLFLAFFMFFAEFLSIFSFGKYKGKKFASLFYLRLLVQRG